MSLETVRFGGVDYGMIIRASAVVEGVKFLTSDVESMQVALMGHPDGTEIKAHIHLEVERTVKETPELIFVRQGAAKVTFYNDNGERLGDRELAQGDAILLTRGGHGLRAIGDFRALEVKQGPYMGVEADKRPI